MVPQGGPQRTKVKAMTALGRAKVRELCEDEAVPPPPHSLADLAAHNDRRVEEQVKRASLVDDEAGGGFQGPT